MTSTQLKTIFAGLSCFAFTTIFSQDTTMKPKTDTSKWPKHDSTKLGTVLNNHIPANQVNLSVFIAQNENMAIAQ